MTVQVDIRDNFKQLERKLDSFRRKQLPFATAGAINATLFDTRKFVVRILWPKSVDVKRKNFPNYAYRVDKASKIDLTGRLFDRSGRDILERQRVGGRAVPFDSQHLAVPTQAALTGRGRISRRANLRLQRGNPLIFKATIKGILGIWERYGRGRKLLRLLYYLKTYVVDPKRYPFYERTQRVVKRVFPGHFNTAFKRALRTAR